MTPALLHAAPAALECPKVELAKLMLLIEVTESAITAPKLHADS